MSATSLNRFISSGRLKNLLNLVPVSYTHLDVYKRQDISLEDEGVNQMKMLYSSCPPEMRDTLLHHTQETVKELTELSEIFEMN